MPITPTYPGVYIEEVPSGVRPITGVATSITAFIGRAWKAPLDEPVRISNFGDYERRFSGLWRGSSMSYAVSQFFQNGGTDAIIVRVANAASPATIDLGGGTVLEAAERGKPSPGTWGRNLVVTVDHDTKKPDPTNSLFNLKILDDRDPPEDDANRGGSGNEERFLNVSMDSNNPRFVTKILREQSQFVQVSTLGGSRPAAAGVPADNTSGDDGGNISDADVVGNEGAKTGIYALKDADLFNLLCIPPLTLGASGTDVLMSTWTAAAKFCQENRAFLIVDAQQNWTVDTAATDITSFSAIVRENAGIYFPRVRLADPLQENNLEEFAPCGIIAGLMSRTDSARGVWKAPAGIEANLRGVRELRVKITDSENGRLNPLGINCLRTFDGVGTVCWGARTLAGQDILASEWKYVPIRRLALFLEESLFRGTKWVVFEPNDEPLWAKIRQNLNAFMMRLFRQGAFEGSTPNQAFYVKCDAETTPPSDRNLGIVNIEVGFAPLKPAEFVIIRIRQIANQGG